MRARILFRAFNRSMYRDRDSCIVSRHLLHHAGLELNRIATFLALACLLTPLAVSAAMYKWRDASGQIHYTQTPPPDTESVEITPEKPPPNAGQPDPQLQQEMEAFQDRHLERMESDASAAREQHEAQTRQQNCERSRQSLTQLSSRGRVKLKEGDEYRALPEEERQELIREAEANLSKYCD